MSNNYCKAVGVECTIKEVKMKSCIECVYLMHNNPYDTHELHKKIAELFPEKEY